MPLTAHGTASLKGIDNRRHLRFTASQRHSQLLLMRGPTRLQRFQHAKLRRRQPEGMHRLLNVHRSH